RRAPRSQYACAFLSSCHSSVPPIEAAPMIQHRVQSACQAENFKSFLEFISPAEGRIAYARRARRLLSPFRSVSIVAVQELFLGNGESLARRGRPTFPRSCHARTEKTLAMSIRQDVRLHQTC